MTVSRPQAALIAADWGTSNFRAQLVDGKGKIIDERASDAGIGKLSGDHEAAFERLVAGWPTVPAIIAGMAGSRQGWREVPYDTLPLAPETLAAHLLSFTAGNGRKVAIVPGVMLRSPPRDGDVIRGEETQIVGLLQSDPDFAGVAILPGTHSKWVKVAAGRIVDFQTYLTGEMFELLSKHSFLRHSVSEEGDDLSVSAEFALGVMRTAVEGLPFLGAIFSVRARQLLLDVPKAGNLAYLSGLIIGGEIAAAKAAGLLKPGEQLAIVGTKSLGRAYSRALTLSGHEAATLDGARLATTGLIWLAGQAGLTGAPAP
jgi:2-dehydro-3-deoxygalactonokinase